MCMWVCVQLFTMESFTLCYINNQYNPYLHVLKRTYDAVFAVSCGVQGLVHLKCLLWVYHLSCFLSIKSLAYEFAVFHMHNHFCLQHFERLMRPPSPPKKRLPHRATHDAGTCTRDNGSIHAGSLLRTRTGNIDLRRILSLLQHFRFM